MIDLDSTTSVTAPMRWDTGVAVHPASGLVATLQSDQGATLIVFARVDPQGVMRPQRRALVLDCDGYETPVFSADGRHFAVRGNAYDNSVEVFEFPSLRRVAGLTLGEPSPGYPYPPEWLEEMHSWSRHNLAFGSSLWIGTPSGSLIECAVDGSVLSERVVCSGVTALTSLASGELVVAGQEGELVLVEEAASAVPIPGESVVSFLAATSDAPDGFTMDTGLSLTDGKQSWEAEDLATVTETTAGDPSWLRIQAAMNRHS
ncbi:hypothetical protein AB0M02_23145 [Actinoplanes sp. NPDC051861]|uniref:hypothetical protein n=1 Tax=Actinoplanes sp. NPDC051861 TaxID=3155170 RepID=UPI003444CA49